MERARRQTVGAVAATVNLRGRLPSTPHALRSAVLFVVGIGGIIYEIVVEHGDKPTLLVLLGAMVGLPAFLSVDESRRKSEPGDGGDP